MQIVVHDFGGYAFPLELSIELSRRGYEVTHLYCGSHQTTPPGVLESRGEGIDNLHIQAICLSKPLNKANFLERWKQENEYGDLVSKAMHQIKPDVILSANTPLDAQKKLQRTCKKAGIPFIFWLQDLIGVATRQILSKKIPVAGSIIGRYYERLEQSLLRQSQAVIGIADSFAGHLAGLSISPEKTHIIPNWAPIQWQPQAPKSNNWSKSQQLDKTFTFLYSGTLGMKHNPDLLLQLARAFQSKAEVVVVSQGMGANWLKEQKRTQNLENLRILPYAPANQLPEVLGSADVLVTLLESDAGAFSVPSKVLTYLCAGRPLLLAIPPDNLAAKMVNEAQAGKSVSPDVAADFLEAANQLYLAKNRDQLGANARSYAEREFDIKLITDRFEQVL